MIPIKLILENFGRHNRSEIDFTRFQSSVIVGRKGDNDSVSNGTGKSTIFQSMKYVLFNRVDFTSLEKVIQHNQDRCRVIYEFSIGDELFKIDRSSGRKAGTSDVKLYRKDGGGWNNLSGRRNSDTEKEIAKVIKINYKAFCYSVLFSQSDMNSIAQLLPSERKKVLKDVLHLNKYSSYEKIAKKKLSDISKDIEKTKTIMATIGNPDNDISKFEEEIKTLQLSLTKCSSVLLDKQTDYDKQSKILSLLKIEREGIIGNAASISNRKKTLAEEIKILKERCHDFASKKSNTGAEHSIIELKIQKLKNEQLGIKFGRSPSLIKNEVQSISSTLLSASIEYKALGNELKALKIPLPAGTICGSCRHELTLEHKKRCQDKLDAEIPAIELKLASLAATINSMKESENKLHHEYENEKKAAMRHADLDMEIKRHQYDLDMKKTMVAEYSKLYDTTNNSLMVKSEEYASIQDPVINTDEIDHKIFIETNLLSLIRNDIVSLSKEDKLMSNNLAITKHSLDKRKEDREKCAALSVELYESEKKYSLTSKVAQAFGPKGIPALITHTIIDDFQIEANTLLTKLCPGLQVQFKIIKDRSDGDQEDTLDMTYILDGIDLEYEQLSGAQKLIVSFAMKLGLAAVLKNRIGVDIKMLFIDEVDQSLDDVMLESFDDTIKKLQSQFKVLVITHNKWLINKFKNVIVVEQNEKLISQVKMIG